VGYFGCVEIVHQLILKIESMPSILQQEKMTNSNDNFLKRVWKAWIRFGMWIGEIMSWVWMPLFYFIIVMPVALGMKFFKDPLRTRGGRQSSFWTHKDLPKLDLDWAKSQGSTVLPSSDSK
jgi:hypothetical protein